MTMWKHYEFSSCEKFSARTEYQYRYVCRHRVHNSARTLCSWEVVFRAYREVYMIHEECRSLKKKKNYFIQRILANATSMIMRSERNPSKTSTVGVSKKKKRQSHNDTVALFLFTVGNRQWECDGGECRLAKWHEKVFRSSFFLFILL